MLIPFLAYAIEDDNVDRSIFDLSLEELSNITVVTAASGFEQNTSEAPANVTVITAQEWQAMGARTLMEVVNKVPGIHISRTFQYEHASIIMRGLSGDGSAKVKVLIDGEPIKNMQNEGLFYGFHLPLNSFKRIEVIKGPGSAIYGADAFAGIINLVSHSFEQTNNVFGGRLGSFDSYDLYGKYRQDIGQAKLLLSFDYMESSDDKNRMVSSDLQTTLDQVFGTNASNAPGSIDEHYQVLSLSAKLQWQKLDAHIYTWRNFDLGLAGGIAGALDTEGTSAVHSNLYKLNYDLSDHVNGTLTATFTYKDQNAKSTLHVFPAGTLLPIGSDGNINFVEPTTVTLFTDGYIGTPSAQGRAAAYRLTHLTNLNPAHLFRWEIGFEQHKYRPSERKNFGPGILNGTESVVDGNITSVTGTPYIFMPAVDRDFYYLSIHDEWRATELLQVTLGARYDHYSDFGSTFNPRLGLNWQYSERMKLKFFAGSAFQAPALDKLYARNNPVGLGNPSLRPETINTYESGFNVEYVINADTRVNLSLFKFNAKDLVEFVFEPEINGSVAQNIGQKDGKGGEVTFKWKPVSNIFINAHYSFISLSDGAGNKQAGIPEKMAYLSINWKFSEQWSWHIDGKVIGKRLREMGDERKDLAGYTWLTSKLERRDILPNLTASLTLNNLLNADAREPSNASIPDDYPLHGRQLMVEFDYTF